MKASRWWALAAFAGALYGQTESAITREGRYWAQTVTGSAPLQGAGMLRISTRGSIELAGESRSDAAYSVTRRVRAQSEQEAREFLSRVEVRMARQGDWATLAVSLPGGDSSADVMVKVPRSLREVQAQSQGGAVHAHDLDGVLRADTSGGHMRLDRIQGDLTVNTGGGEVRLGSIGGTVRCMSGGGSITADVLGRSAQLNTGGGEIVVKEAGGPLSASTGGGNIHVDRAKGPVSAATGGGSVEVNQASGPVTAETSAGAIKVRSARGVRCETGAGAIQLYAVSGGLRVATGMGTIRVELAAQSLEDSVMSTGQGDITVWIPSNLAVTVQAITDSPGFRKIVSDFSEIRTAAELRGGRAEAQGSLNGGGPLLKLTASGGTIYLRRQK